MSELPFFLERTIVIGAPPEIVFRYFTDPVRFAAWWGAGSDIDCRPGGRVHIRHPGGVVASGEILEVDVPRRIVFTYGYEGEGKPIAPGASRVTIHLSEDLRGTKLHLRHDVPTSAARDEHEQGWRFQLALFSNVVSREVQAGAAGRIDSFFDAWSEADAARRRKALDSCAEPDLSFGDAYSCTSGLDDLNAHLAAARVHMPGVSLARDGEVEQCQGTAMARWIARKADGSLLGRGTHVFDFAPNGKIRRIVGFWN